MLVTIVVLTMLLMKRLNLTSKSEVTQRQETPTLGEKTLDSPKETKGVIAPVNPAVASETETPAPSTVQKVIDAYTSPIFFYGLVVDQNGVPVEGANIRIDVVDSLFGKPSKVDKVSGSDGKFELIGARGSSASVWVLKHGYYSIKPANNRFVYGGVRGDGDPSNPTAQSPAVFILRKMGETEPLVAVDRDVITPKSGQPVEISLRTGRAVGAGRGDIIVECWTNNEGLDPNKNEPYDWRMRLSVPGGGLFERVGEFNFVAPESGYQPALEVNISKSAEKWKGTTQGEYFIKTREGTFARLNFTMYTGGGHFVTIKSFLNPKVSSRNLEFDPAKVIKPAP